MRVALLGGTGFIGPLVIAQLVQQGHDVVVIHRGETEPESRQVDVHHIHVDRHALNAVNSKLRSFAPDVAVDMRPMSERDALEFVAAFSGVARRAVVVSSSDVYRAYGRLNETEPGPPDATPLDEDAALREQLFTDRDAKPHDKAPSLEDYDKLLVERVVLTERSLPTIVLRLGMIHGPRSYRHWPLVKRMFDARPAIILADRFARWRASLGFSANVAHAITLAAERGEGTRVYNVAESDGVSTLDLSRALAGAASWPGDVIVVSNDRLPESLRAGASFSQDFVLDTSRIRSELGYRELVPFDRGLTEMVEWMRAHPPGPGDPMAALKLDYELEDQVLRAARPQ
jgi:nucleoside-diphosphate-sugar epimerase